jgi:hypothetical protein
MLTRRNPPPAPDPPADAFAEDELGATDLAKPEDAELSNKVFFAELRRDVERVKAGELPSIVEAMRPPIKERPHGRRWRARDRNGKVL